MSSFTLTDGGGAALGQGIGNAFKAYAMSGMARDKAQLDAGMRVAQMGNQRASADKHAAEAAILAEKLGLMRDPLKASMLQNNVPLDKRAVIEDYQQTGKFGPAYDAPADGMGPVQPPPIDPALIAKISKDLGLAMNTNMTGSNVQQMANARGANQQADITQSVLDGVLPATAGAQARFAGHGGARVFDNVGNNGASINNVTGEQAVTDQPMHQAAIQALTALATQRGTAATANTARAGASTAKAEATRNGTGAGSKRDPDKLTYPQAVDDARAAWNATHFDRLMGRPMKGAPTLEDFTADYLRKEGFDPATKKRVEGDKNPAAAPSEPKIKLPQGVTPEGAREQAKAAIANGKDRKAVLKRLEDMGVTTEGI